MSRMNRYIIREGIIWLALVGLTVFGFYNSGTNGPGVAYLVLTIGLVKFFLIFFDFMEMRHAHPLWKLGMTVFMLLLVTAVGFSI
ncbi:MAG: cytochrome C oxidase subunit IV family protein [Polyangiales bacterium]